MWEGGSRMELIFPPSQLVPCKCKLYKISPPIDDKMQFACKLFHFVLHCIFAGGKVLVGFPVILLHVILLVVVERN